MLSKTPLLNRRRFIQSIVAAATVPAMTQSCRANDSRIGPLRPDPEKILDLPPGFHHRVISRAGEPMSDGLLVPGAHDGMATFPGADGRIILVRNHEMQSYWPEQSAFRKNFANLPEAVRS